MKQYATSHLWACLPPAKRAGWHRSSHLVGALLFLIGWPTWSTAQTEPSWQYLGPDVGHVYALVAEAADPAVLYAATNDGLYKTATGGSAWNQLPVPGMDQQFRSVCIDPQDGRTIYVATSRAVYVSRDGGNIWLSAAPLFAAQPNAVSPGIRQIQMFSQLPRRVYVSTDNGAYVSDDGGVSWKAFGLQAHFVTALSVDPANREHWLASVWNSSLTAEAGSGDGGIYRSVDGGTTWERVFGSVTLRDSERAVQAAAAILQEPISGRWIAQTDVGIAISSDGGASWTLSDTPYPDRTGFLHYAAGQIIASDGRGGMMFSRDGGLSWESSTIPRVRVTDLLTVDDGTWYAGGSGGVYKSADGGQSWTAANTGIQAAAMLRVEAVSLPARLYAAVSGAGLLRYDVDEGTWSSILASLTSLNAAVFADFRVDPSDSNHLVLLGDSAFETRDGGATWTPLPVSVDAGDGVVRDLGAFDVAFDPRDSNTLYVIAATGIHKSVDGGLSWNASLVPPLESREYFHIVRVSAADRRTLYVLGNKGLRQSTDGGATWSEPVGISNKMGSLGLYPDPADANTVFVLRGTLRKSSDGGRNWRELALTQLGLVTDLVFDLRQPGTMSASAPNVGLSVSRDNGENWVRVVPALPASTLMNALALDAQTGALYVGTINKGVFSISGETLVEFPVNPEPTQEPEPGSGGGVVAILPLCVMMMAVVSVCRRRRLYIDPTARTKEHVQEV